MCTKNNFEKGYVNGTLGRVVGFDSKEGWPLVRLADGRTIKSEVTEAPGDPEMPLSNEQLVDKAKGYLTMAIGAADAAAMCQAVGDFADPNFNLAAMLKILYRPIDR